MKRLEAFHLFQRSGFGLTPSTFEWTQKTSRRQVIDKLFEQAKVQSSVKVDLPKEFYSKQKKAIKGVDKKAFDKLDRKAPVKLGGIWLEKMTASSSSALLEKMTLFWHGHFACRPKKGIFAVNYLNSLRSNALGNFRQLLLDISKDAAMLRFLNNQQNKKRAPNENFARELLELFTLGRGQYSEKDIKEAARAFTGWSSTTNGEFFFKERHHDYGEKEFRNQKGTFNGEDIIDLILKDKNCANFIASRIYSFFVHEKLNQKHIEELATTLYKSNYNLDKTMRYLFSAEWFYNKAFYGKRIKSPVEVVVSQSKILGLTFKNNSSIVFLEKLLGQVLMEPPNVAGWPGGRSWIDNSTLSVRTNLPYYLANNSKPEINAKSSLKETKKSYPAKHIDVDSNPKELLEWLATFSPKDQTKALISLLVPNNPELEAHSFTKDTATNQVIAILGSLEFQLG